MSHISYNIPDEIKSKHYIPVVDVIKLFMEEI